MLHHFRRRLIHRALHIVAGFAATLRRRAEAAERRIHYTRRITQRFDDLVHLIEASNLPPTEKRVALDDVHVTARTALRTLRTFRHRTNLPHHLLSAPR